MTERSDQITYQCPECGLHYRDENVAKQCEKWCREYKSCNLKIIQSAVENEDS